MKEKEIIGALIGLGGAINNNGKTENTDVVVKEAVLFTGFPEDERTEISRKTIIDKIHREKYTISPGCETCANPCGNTSDYDIRLFDIAEETLIKAKEELWTCIFEYTVGAERAGLPDLYYKAIGYIGYDLKPESYEKMIAELRELN